MKHRRNLSLPVSLTLFLVLLPFLLCKQEYKELFTNTEPGYLFSIGANAYVGRNTNPSTSTSSFEGVNEQPEAATPFIILISSYHGVPYSNILLADASSEKEPRYQEETRKVALALSDNGDAIGYALSPLEQKSAFYFTFSPVVIPHLNAMHIYTNGGCLSVDERGTLSFATCVDTPSEAWFRQLFRWVNHSWYKSGIRNRTHHMEHEDRSSVLLSNGAP
ncbi:hypothetical protein NEFER03_2024 [Nematocida sp. LUAm3]|nr:hypothetical protein NEFER03_2024 [Nematocida sp. LUAm3]KAI5174498.1 hypothetical protein NEFER02_0619 [Nematocida sp. LUAm2]KAI5179149.1 hypothetical protein NEFER01_2012 [Nematocida sp. LUAm1]